MRDDRRRLTLALLLSLLVHTSLLSLAFGGEGRWRFGLNLPWLDRRLDVADLRVLLTPAPTADETSAKPSALVEPAPQPGIDPQVANRAVPPVAPSRARLPRSPKSSAQTTSPAVEITPEPQTPAASSNSTTESEASTTTDVAPLDVATARGTAANAEAPPAAEPPAPSRADSTATPAPDSTAPATSPTTSTPIISAPATTSDARAPAASPSDAPDVIAVAPSDEATWSVPPPSVTSTPEEPAKPA